MSRIEDSARAPDELHPSEAPDQDHNVFELTREALDALPYGVITLDRRGTVLRYNETEAAFARRAQDHTIGLSFFTDVAPCTNVQAFKGRFDAFAAGTGSGVDRFDFSFAFRWGRHDVSITLLRKADHEEINVLVRGRSMGAADPVQLTGPGDSRSRRRSDRAEPPPLDQCGGRRLQPPVTWRYGSPAEAAWRARIHPDDAGAVTGLVASARALRQPYAIEYRALDDERRAHVYVEQGSGAEDMASVRDVTDEREREETLRRAANYDALTGLANRNLLLRRIDEAAREAAATNRIAAILFLDLDGFKSVNDTFGHVVGDALLRALSLRLGECVRGGDTIARLDGDEFVVLLTHLDDTPTVERTVRRVLSAISRPIEISGRRHFVTASIGVSMAPYHGTDPTTLLRSADSAMYASKTSSRNGFQWYTAEMSAAIAANVQTEEELRRALDRGELEVYYQPIVDAELNGIVAAEALVRWNHPERGLVMPAQFITVAERSGLIAAVGEFVLRESCRQVVRWAADGRDVRVCVNVSTGQFRQKNFTDTVRAVLAETGAPAGLVELEVTESMMVDGFGETMNVLTDLKLMGVRLAVDDFGTGYSSLAYLKYLPIDTLKLDRTFVIDIAVDAFDRAIATTVMKLAHELKLECIAEGIENEEQMRMLRGIGCRHMQGYLFGRPGPAAAFPRKVTPG